MEFREYDTRIAGYAVITEGDRLLVTWFNGQGGGRPGWSLPGGGVEFEESVEAGIVREAKEETGYDIALDSPLGTHAFTRPASDRDPRPFKALRILYAAHVIGGTLGTLEVGGSTDVARWRTFADLAADESCTDVARIALGWLAPGRLGP